VACFVNSLLVDRLRISMLDFFGTFYQEKSTEKHLLLKRERMVVTKE
jgi:hypothetical protein